MTSLQFRVVAVALFWTEWDEASTLQTKVFGSESSLCKRENNEQGPRACILDLMKWLFQAAEFYPFFLFFFFFDFERSVRNSLMVINFTDSTETIKGALFKEEAVKSWLDTLIRVTLPLWWHQGNCTESPITTSSEFAFYTLLPKHMLVVVLVL